MYQKEGNNLALKGFINLYCKGPKQDRCVRKKVSKELGSPGFVPPNMLPNGLPKPKTDISDWSEKVMLQLK